jgi:hypothetical protein
VEASASSQPHLDALSISYCPKLGNLKKRYKAILIKGRRAMHRHSYLRLPTRWTPYRRGMSSGTIRSRPTVWAHYST